MGIRQEEPTKRAGGLTAMDLSETPAVVLQRHPWEVARLDFFRRLIQRKGLHLRPLRILDVGSGDAWFAMNLLPFLAAGSHITCFDPAYNDSHLRSLGPHPALCLVTTRPDAKFDVVLLLDVLEHVEHDAEWLAEIATEVVPSGGTVVISLPAWSGLFGPHDERLKHFRRYQPAAAIRLVQRSGLEMETHGGLFHSLLLPRIVQLVIFRLGLTKRPPANAGEWQGGPRLTALLANLLQADTRLSLLAARVGIRFPGLGWWALCRKP